MFLGQYFHHQFVLKPVEMELSLEQNNVKIMMEDQIQMMDVLQLAKLNQIIFAQPNLIILSLKILLFVQVYVATVKWCLEKFVMMETSMTTMVVNLIVQAHCLVSAVLEDQPYLQSCVLKFAGMEF